MPTYATRQLGLAASGSFIAGLLTGTIQLLLIPVFGLLSDRYGRPPIAAAAAAAFLLAIYPMFAWLAASPTLQTLLLCRRSWAFCRPPTWARCPP
jgi:MFS transporter, MHS family, proline/betaine transporter